MTFDSRSIQHLRELGRQLPKELPKPDTTEKQKRATNNKLHPIETEQNPQVLFQELMNASPDGNVPSHLMARLKETEAKQRNQNDFQETKQINNATKPLTKKQQLKKETESDILYASFNRLLLEDED